MQTVEGKEDITENNSLFRAILCFHKENSLKSLFYPPYVRRPKSSLQINENTGILNDRFDHFPIGIAWED